MNMTKPMQTNFDQIKTESGTRSRRIGQILRTAFTQASAEIKEGYTVIRPLTSELSSTVTEDLKQKSNQVSSTVKAAWGEESTTPNRWRRVLRVMTTAMGQTLEPPFKKHMDRVDTTFTDWYGKYYTILKRGFQSLRNKDAQSTSADDASAVQTKSLQVIPRESVTVDVVASPVESAVQ
ncbi:MAG: hypothetical protein HC851_14365 [Acaryochloris sp. RU_4_1]|nr:hypothetical protein [Acaryochloris sp. SU_5_25]NJM66752.1 hypothetical protein [Acaryochloris sp. RU_4_1]NJR55635.1 hypothetical protein [Acaryochloris sp. CRU_2_0]